MKQTTFIAQFLTYFHLVIDMHRLINSNFHFIQISYNVSLYVTLVPKNQFDHITSPASQRSTDKTYL